MSDSSEPATDLSGLVARVVAGDQQAAHELVERLWPQIIRIVRGHLPRRNSEEDLSQEVFMKVFARINQWRADRPLEHWVSRVAVNTCLDALRWQKRRPEVRWADLSEAEAGVLDNVLHDESEATSGDLVAARELAQKLLETLKPTDRLVVTMMDMEGRSVADVQRHTGWSATLVKVRVFRARRKLRKAFEELEKTNEAGGPKTRR